jgi:hypothetical protein
MKRLLPFALLLLAGCGTRWTVVPTSGGKWRSCKTESDWTAEITGCSSPISYDEALWWSETQGGKKVGQ